MKKEDEDEDEEEEEEEEEDEDGDVKDRLREEEEDEDEEEEEEEEEEDGDVRDRTTEEEAAPTEFWSGLRSWFCGSGSGSVPPVPRLLLLRRPWPRPPGSRDRWRLIDG